MSNKITKTKLNQLIREEYNKLLLTEDSIYNIYEKYYSNNLVSDKLKQNWNNAGFSSTIYDKSWEWFSKIITIDPYTKFPNKMGKYSKWLLKYVKTLTQINELYRVIDEDRSRIQDYLKRYDRLVMSGKLPQELRDINKFESPNELYKNVIKPYWVKIEIGDVAEKEIELIKNDEAKVYFNGHDWKIIIPKTEEASCVFGSGTEWCTTWGQYSTNPDYRQRTNYFSNGDRYGQNWENDPLYIIINKSNPKEKYQFHFGSEQFKDYSDNDVNPLELLEKYPELRKLTPEIFESLFNVTDYRIYGDNRIDVYRSINLSNKIKMDKLPFNFNEVHGDFDISYNSLITLEGCPKKVHGDFSCFGNLLSSLEFSPEIVGGDYSCEQNGLTSLEGCPTHIKRDLYISGNRITTLVGFPKTVDGNIIMINNKGKKFTEDDIRSRCDVGGHITIAYY